MRRRVVVFLAALVFLVPTLAWALGADHPSTPVRNDRWPQGLAELVNRDNRVHGYFVNEADVFFFGGDAAALNAFLLEYADLPNAKLRIVLHDGKLDVKSPWDEQPRAIAADWKLSVAPHDENGARPAGRELVTRVDVWLGGAVKRADIRVPDKVGVDPGLEMVRVRTPATQPVQKYRLTRQTVAGMATPQWVFIIVTPEGYPWVGTEARLRWMIEQAVPAGATLEWNPGCKRIGGEPLETVEELDALKAFCAQRNVTFVHMPGG